MRRYFVLFALLLFVRSAAAQQSRASETIEISIVNLDVVVTDKSGKRITGLKTEDFEIREAGKVQPITNFAEYGRVPVDAASGVTAAAPSTANAARPPRTIVVFIEWEKLAPFASEQIYDSLRTLLRGTVERGDRVMIVRWAGRAEIRQAFTDDLEKVEAVLAQLESEHEHLRIADNADNPGDVQREQLEADHAVAEAMTAQPGNLPVDPKAVADALAEAQQTQNFARGAALRQLQQIRAKAAALEALVNGMAAHEGRKVLIMATRRFGAMAGAEFFRGAEVPQDVRRELSTESLQQSLVRTANAHGVTLYPIYHSGLRWNPDDSSVYRNASDPLAWTSDVDIDRGGQEHKAMSNETVALTALAEATGGVTAFGASAIASMLPRIADDLASYYSLAYRARATGKDATRRVEVRAKNRDYVVRARTQFVEKSDDTRMKDRLVANLLQPLDTATLPFELELGALRSSAGKRWEVPLTLRIPIGSLTTLPRGEAEHGAFSVYTLTGGSLGVTSDMQHRTQSFEIPRADLERAKASHFTYELTVVVDDKASRLSVAVMDDTAREVGLRSVALPAR